ncbi:leucyl/phenylalanyl-tRNA--protein transferase [Microbulbifer sp. 2205BS26-8]|uniref:leucyl/phenylalanyl-tRNA--protein transferase n=1 Tax=Microbulbifer sp. 2205BS26-8 TaxID=3064386 RepID=UPI00273ED045|nr:leucyl/phenylalanyl-tRNA--protein transferase [Microbulbifer sp. 2205BS26-8]MDP5208932.1 leucyl/phenylalanyl-tRNA--protein transferase [Microbulbifer sp. 2205BS26-8]
MAGSRTQRLVWLDDQHIAFPSTAAALTDPNGLLAAGGDLTPEWLLAAYRRGIFPWYSDGQPILWWSPSPRCVVFPQAFRVGRSLQKVLRRKTFRVTFDRAFESVIDGCRIQRASGEGTWITDRLRRAFIHMHHLGLSHSVEVWRNGDLVGGLYGIALGRVFFGESMFHREKDASKVAFVHLVRQLELWGCPLIDCQVGSPHLTSWGAVEIYRRDFEHLLKSGLKQPAFAKPWKLSWTYG